MSATMISFPRIELPAFPLCSMSPSIMLTVKLLSTPPNQTFKNLRITLNQPISINRFDLGFFLVNNLERAPEVD